MINGSVETLKAWGSGLVTPDVFGPGSTAPEDHTAVTVLARSSHLAPLLESGIVGPQSRVFVPGGTDSGPEPMVMGYEGSLGDAGDEVQVGPSFFLQTQDYGTSEYLSLIGATLVRVVDNRDLGHFLEDADRARESGEFPAFLTHHLVQLCDAPALGATMTDDGPRLRLYVDGDGGLSTSPSGSQLGQVGDSLQQLEKEWQNQNAGGEGSCSVCLGAVVDDVARARAVAERPWLGRYHGAISGLQHMRSREVGLHNDIRVSGFGGRLDAALAEVDDPADERQASAPVLMWVGDDVYLHEASTDRAFRLDRGTGILAERLLVHGSIQSASVSGHRESLTKVSDFFARAGVPLCA